MTAKKPLPEPDKISQPYLINAVIGGRKRINLVIIAFRKIRDSTSAALGNKNVAENPRQYKRYN